MDDKPDMISLLLNIYRQQQRIVVEMQEAIKAEGEAVNASDQDALARAASGFEELSREYLRWDVIRQETENTWAREDEGLLLGEEALSQVRADLRQELQQAQQTAALQHQQALAGLSDIKDQHARVLQGKQTLRSYGNDRTIDPRCIDQYR